MSEAADANTPDTPPQAAETLDADPAHKHRPHHKDPDHIGPYRLLERIGEGGMGLVYKAEQRQPVRRIVALKVIKLGMDTHEVVARFEAERQALALMSHPNVAKVFEAGVTEQGRPFFAMEFVAGVPLTDYCDQNKLTTKERLELFIAVCHAVQHAHQKGIIHRDLKPSNILVTLFDGQPVPKVIDFGIAKATNQALTQRTLFTQTGSLIGTPEYMSPEQAMTNGLDVDTRTDIYALGVILYELLVGFLPFDPKALRSGGLDGIARILKETDPEKPSTRISMLDRNPTPSPGTGSAEELAKRHRTDARTLQREIRGDLDWITLKAMEKDRTRRYETANGLAQDIRRHLDNELVLARPPSTLYRLSKLARRYKAVAIVIGAIGAALIIGIAGTTIGIVRARAALHKAETAEYNANVQKDIALHLLDDVKRAKATAETQAQRAESANRFMRSMLGSAPPGAKGAPSEMRVADVLDRAAQQLDKLQNRPELEIDGRLTIAATYVSLNQSAKAAENYGRALTLSRSLSGPESEQTLQITADLLLVQSEIDATNFGPMAHDAVASAKRVLGARHPVTIDTLNSLAMILHRKGDEAGAATILRDLVAQTREDSYVPPPKGSSRFLNNLAMIVKAQGHLSEAEQLQREAIAVAKKEQREDPKRDATFLVNLAENLRAQRKLPEALAVYHEAVDLGRQALGPSHPDTLHTIEALALLLEQRESFAEALPLRQELLSRFRNEEESESSGLTQRMAVAELLLRLGQDEPARQMFTQTVEGLIERSYKNVVTPEYARGWWGTALLFQSLRIDRPWAGPALRSVASYTAYQGITDHWWSAPPMDCIEWDKLHFKMQLWLGDAAAEAKRSASSAPVLEGGLSELWKAADPKPGVYLFSLSLPRRGAPPIRCSQWVFLAPWQLSLHALEKSVSSSVESWNALFASEPNERRPEPTLCYTRFGVLGYGFGPAHKTEDFAFSATATEHLPPGQYKLSVFMDGSYQVYADRKLVLDGYSASPTEVLLTKAPTDVNSEFRLQWAYGTGPIVLAIEPVSPIADEWTAATRSAPTDLDLTAERVDAALAVGSPTAQAIFNRGVLRARRGQFEPAADDMARTIELNPSAHWAWYYRGCLLAYLGKQQAYRDFTREILARFATSKLPSILERTAKACLLIPGVVEDQELLLKLTDQAVTIGGEYIYWYQMASGIAKYRAGRYDDAIQMFVLALPRLKGVQGGVTCESFHAMALQKLNRPAEARQVFDQARDMLWEIETVPGKDDLTTGFENWLITHIALREAEQTLGVPPLTTRPSTRPKPRSATTQSK